jgi:hypothetical protein
MSRINTPWLSLVNQKGGASDKFAACIAQTAKSHHETKQALASRVTVESLEFLSKIIPKSTHVGQFEVYFSPEKTRIAPTYYILRF